MSSQNKGVVVPIEFRIDDRMVRYLLDCEEDTFRSIVLKYPSFASVLTMPDMVRAFQQITLSNYKPNNDKHIYDSIITTIKAAAYEENHVKQDAMYFMLSVFEGEMVQYDFDSGISRVIDDIKYVNRHFIDSDDRYYCVRFIKLDALERVIDEYDEVSEELPQLLDELRNEFKKDVLKMTRRWKYFWNDFEKKFFEELYEHYEINDEFFSSLCANQMGIRPYLAKSGKLHLAFNLCLYVDPASCAQDVNKDEFCRNLMARLLKEFYGYEGPFVIENDSEAEKAFKDMCSLK